MHEEVDSTHLVFIYKELEIGTVCAIESLFDFYELIKGYQLGEELFNY